MFATFTDWEFDDMDVAKKTATDFWPKMKAAGATDFRATQTGPNSLRSMTLWKRGLSSKEFRERA